MSQLIKGCSPHGCGHGQNVWPAASIMGAVQAHIRLILHAKLRRNMLQPKCDICTLVEVEGYGRQLIVTSNCSFLQMSVQLFRSAPLNASQAKSLYDRQRALEPLLTLKIFNEFFVSCTRPCISRTSREQWPQGTYWLWHPQCLSADHGATLQVSARMAYGDCP